MTLLSKIQHTYSKTTCELVIGRIAENNINNWKNFHCFIGYYHFLIYIDTRLYIFRSNRCFDVNKLNDICLNFNTKDNVLQISLPCLAPCLENNCEKDYPKNNNFGRLNKITDHCLLKIDGVDAAPLHAPSLLPNCDFAKKFCSSCIRFECDLDTIPPQRTTNETNGDIGEMTMFCQDEYKMNFVKFYVASDIQNASQYTINFQGFIVGREEECSLQNLPCTLEIMQKLDAYDAMENDCWLSSIFLGICYDKSESTCTTSSDLSAALSFMDSESKESGNHKTIIKKIIRNEIIGNRASLVQVMKCTAEMFKMPLSHIDCAYIERNYMKHLSILWLKEVTEAIQKLTFYKSGDIIRHILEELDNVEGINDVPKLFTQLKLYGLLTDHSKLLLKQDEQVLTRRFKKVCWEETVSYSETLETELRFIKIFIDYLSVSLDFRLHIVKLKLKEFCCGKSSFEKLLKGIIDLDECTYDVDLIDLQALAKYFLHQGQLSLIEKFKEVMRDYIKPVEINERKIDNRSVFEVVGKIIVVSEILDDLEGNLSKSANIEEVRFVGVNVMHINRGFKNEIWHGKNLVILTNIIYVHEEVILNVSGMDDTHFFDSNAGTAEDGQGKQGTDGRAGESGGNVLIQAKIIHSPEKLTVISNGGNGSNGQDGGDGKKGADGKSLTKEQFHSKFPSVVKFLGSQDWRRQLVRNTSRTIREEISVTNQYVVDPDHTFIRGETQYGNKIVFSYCNGSFSTRYQGYLLYTGSCGHSGECGGEYGLGGQGGYAGEILIMSRENNQEFNVVTFSRSGKDGENGKGGLYGEYGKDGWDIGYLDYQWWSNAEYRGEDMNSKLAIKYHNSNHSDSVWCAQKKQYASITSTGIQHKKVVRYEKRACVRQINVRQHSARAARKKAISQNRILTSYSSLMDSMEESPLQGLQTHLDSTKRRALQSLAENQQQQEKHATALTVKSSIRQVAGNHYSYSEVRATYKVNTDGDRLLSTLQSEHQSLCNWLNLRSIELSRSKMEKLFFIFESVKKDFLQEDTVEIIETIEKLLIDKYGFATLRAVAMDLLSCNTFGDSIELTAESAARYLIEDTESDNSIYIPILGAVNQYFYKNSKDLREKIVKFCEDRLQANNENADILQHSLKTFILDVAESEDAGPSFKKYRDDYREFTKMHKQNLETLFSAFKNVLSNLKDSKLIELCSDVDSLRNKLEAVVQEDSLLKALYDRCKYQFQLEFAWDQDQTIMQEYYHQIREKGPLSIICRELLANIYDINIRLYVADEGNKLYLQDNHNPSAKNVTCILFRNNNFTQMSIDKDFLRLEQERQWMDKMYAQILWEMKSLKQKQDFDDYYERKKFLAVDKGGQFDSQSFCSDEDEDIRQIIVYFPEEERQQLKARLEKLTSQCIGQNRVLHVISQRFSTEGRHVTFQEFSFLINSIISSSVEERTYTNNYCWIIGAYSQKSWIDELVILQIENYFRKPLASKSKLRKYLQKIQNIDILLLLSVKLDQCTQVGCYISIQCIEDILYLLSCISNGKLENLEGLQLSEWTYVLKEKYWSWKLKDLTEWQKSDLATASYYLLSMENAFGTHLVEKFVTILKANKTSLLPNVLNDILSNFHNDEWHLSEDVMKILDSHGFIKWKIHMSEKYSSFDKDRDISELMKIIKENANTSQRISDNLSNIEESLIRIRMASKASFGGSLTAGVFGILKSAKNKTKAISGNIKNNFTSGVSKLWGTKKSVDNTSQTISENQTTKQEDSSKSKCEPRHISADRFTEDDILDWVKESRYIDSNDIDRLSVVDRAIELKRDFKLRDTQILAVHALLSNDRNTLAQVSTGEGKSLIVVALSIMKVLRGQKVDVITSSSVLAKRDAEENEDIYQMFDICVSHNCSEDIDKRKTAYSGNQVVYGDLPSYQRDYLLDKFYGKNIFGDRNFENIIVDEVDSMLLDKGNNMLYLSHDLPGLDKLDSLYLYIWQWINQPARQTEELSYIFNTAAIKEEVLGDLYGLLKLEDIGSLGPELGDQQKNVIYERLVKAEILDSHHGTLLKDSIDDIKLSEVLSPDFIHYENRLGYLFKECFERERHIRVPNYLRPFVEQHLEQWIESAINAYFIKPGQDYVVDVDRTGSSSGRDPIITILDRDTGEDQANSQWDEALHQFLQLKHGCKLSLQSLKAVYISNVSFFKLYTNLYGLTGTLGSKRERDLLKEIHNVDFVTIPTTKSKKFVEYQPILCTCQTEWIASISDCVRRIIKTRSVLIICETVDDVGILHKAMGGIGQLNVHTYTRDYEEFDIGQSTHFLEQGHVIIATNLAGRGTDISITPELRDAGGLHVCLTYLPNNIRIEQQAFGRTARKGEKGSGQLIICNTQGPACRNSKIFALRQERYIDELCRISDIKAHYKTKITVEEKCFEAFKDQYEQLKIVLENKKVPAEVQTILLHSCLDKWAFWIDENGKHIGLDGRGQRVFESPINKFKSQWEMPEIDNKRKYWLTWIGVNPSQMVKLGKYLSQTGLKDDLSYAIDLFDMVIQQEPYFSEAAHYYKAFSLIKQIDWQQKPVEEGLLKSLSGELQNAARIFDDRSMAAINAAGVVGKIKKFNKESIIQIEAYEEQQRSFANIYYIFSRSIDDIFGHLVNQQSFVTYDINEEMAEFLYEDLFENGVLQKLKIQMNISEHSLKSISYSYGVQFDALWGFLSKYKGCEFDERKLQKVVKEEIEMPSREVFWKLLIQQQILTENVKYIIVDKERLQKVDPSLFSFLMEKSDSKELVKPTFEPSKHEIFFNADLIKKHEGDNVFLKDNIIEILGKYKYLALKRNGLFAVNMKAHIDQSKINSTNFVYFDSLSLKDFSKIHVAEDDAEKIVAQLVQQKVIEKKRDCKKKGEYGLCIQYDEINEIQLPLCPVYENVVKGLLYVNFAYRLALQRIVRQLEEKNDTVYIHLMAKTHHSLLSELLRRRVIQHATVEIEDVEEAVKSLYVLPTPKENILGMLSRNPTIRAAEDIASLFDHLVEKGWIKKFSIGHNIQEKGIGNTVVNTLKSLVQDLYTLDYSAMKNKSLNASYKSFEKPIKLIFDRRLQLAKECNIRHISSVLERSRCKLKSLNYPDSKLKHINQFSTPSNFGMVEELYVYILNGMDSLLQLEEKRWTRQAILNAVLILVNGVAQISVGVAIELFSVGIMTNLGAGFLNAGINDIYFSISCLISGLCSWTDCKRHIMENAITTAFMFCVGAIWSRGVKVSRFGRKIAGPTIEVGGKYVADMCGTQLIKTAGGNVVRNEVLKRISVKALEGIAFGLVSAGVNTVVENHLQVFCNGIASTILSSMEQKFEEHTVWTSLERAYRTMGNEKAREMVNHLNNNLFTEQGCEERFLRIFGRIAEGVVRGFAEAETKISKAGGKITSLIHHLNRSALWAQEIEHICHILTATTTLLDNVNTQINAEIRRSADNNIGSLDENLNETMGEDYENFKKEVMDQWKLQLRKNVGRIIEQHIVTPILKESTRRMVKWAGKKVQGAYQNAKERKYNEYFERRKQKFHEELKSATELTNTKVSPTEDHIREIYHRDLLKLMMKTKSPELFAACVRENTPMDISCVSACTKIVHTIFKERGLSGVTVVVEGENGVRQSITSAPEGVETIVVRLSLKDNHFQFCDTGTSENTTGSNNCLYEALSEALPELRNIEPTVFRNLACHHIVNDPVIQEHIRKGWHRLPMSFGMFGGATNRARSKLVEDPESSPNEECRVLDHISDRLTRYIRFGGILQRISEETNIESWEIVEDGASKYQDKSSKRGKDGIQAAHVVRAGAINTEIKNGMQHKLLYRELRNFLGHTQNIPKYANEWRGIGGEIDRLQARYLKSITSIDFSRSLTAEDAGTLQCFKDYFVEALDKHIYRFDTLGKDDLMFAKLLISNMNIEELFEKGKGGYEGTYKKAYQ